MGANEFRSLCYRGFEILLAIAAIAWVVVMFYTTYLVMWQVPKNLVRTNQALDRLEQNMDSWATALGPDISLCYEYYQDGTGRWAQCVMDPEFRNDIE